MISLPEDYDVHAYYKYVDGVLSGKIAACEYVKLACQRFIDFSKRKDIYFDEADVDKRIDFIYCLRHSTGVHHNKHFRLLDWQQFAIANIFGWKYKDTHLRVTRNVFIMVSRKNGKTALAAAIALATLIGDREHGSEIYCVANNTKQASIALKQTQDFANSVDTDGSTFKRYRSELRIPRLNSIVQVLSSDSMGIDGFNPSLFILDEIHAASTWDTYNVMKSGQGMRQQPLAIVITTAGFLIGPDYPCYSMWQTSIDILRNIKQDDSQFSLIYQLDDADDWHDESTWPKCCPSLGQTVTYEYMREQVTMSDNNSSLLVGVLTKNFNRWVSSQDVWIADEYIVRSMQPVDMNELAKKSGSYLYIGTDLASVSDLTAISALVRTDDGVYVFKSWALLPDEALDLSPNAPLYREWKRKGYLITTSGNVTDYDYVTQKILELDKIIPVEKVAYDAWNATSWAIDMEAHGMPLEPFSQSLGNFNEATKTFERLLKSGRVIIDNSPITRWCFQSVTLKFDANENCKPTKGKSKSAKIDIVISMLEALGCYLYHHRDAIADLTVI